MDLEADGPPITGPKGGFERAEFTRARISGLLRRTPTLRVDALGSAALYLKAENKQRTGSFKIRSAAANVISSVERMQTRKAGVVSDSSGNYAYALAYIASIFGVPATLVVPANASPFKLRLIQRYGCRVIQHGVTWDNRKSRALALSRDEGLRYVPADTWDGIAGAGTIALELLEDAGEFDQVIVPVGTGGLLAGIAMVVKHARPHVRVIGAHPAAAGHARLSFRSGTLFRLQRPAPTIADGARALQLGVRPFEIVHQLVDDIQEVSEDAILAATRWLSAETGLVVEPTGALAVALVLDGAPTVPTACIVSGGNVEPTYARSAATIV